MAYIAIWVSAMPALSGAAASVKGLAADGGKRCAACRWLMARVRYLRTIAAADLGVSGVVIMHSIVDVSLAFCRSACAVNGGGWCTAASAAPLCAWCFSGGCCYGCGGCVVVWDALYFLAALVLSVGTSLRCADSGVVSAKADAVAENAAVTQRD